MIEPTSSLLAVAVEALAIVFLVLAVSAAISKFWDGQS